MINVLFLIPLLDRYGGTEKHVSELVTHLPKGKVRPVVCCFKDGVVANDIRNAGVKVYVLPVTRIYDFNALYQAYRLRNIIRRENIQIIQTFHPNGDIYGGIVARWSRVPVIISSRRDLGLNKTWKHILGYKVVNRFVDVILANSHAVKMNVMEQEGQKWCEKIQVIYNGLDLNGTPALSDRESIRKQLHLDGNHKLVGYVGNFFHPIKGQEWFIKAAPYILQKFPETRFIMMGEGPLVGPCEKLVRSLGIVGNVHFLGSVRNVMEIMTALDVVVLTSLSEGFPNAILEAMVMSKPIVATDVGGTPEIIINGVTGLLIPPKDPTAVADAVIKLFGDPKKAEEMGMAGRRRIETDFSMTGMIDKMVQLYQSLLIDESSKNIVQL